MRGVVLHGGRELSVKEFPDPKPERGQVVVRMKAAAICGSDIHMYLLPKEAMAKRPETIAGHEPSGVVESVAEDVTQVKPGDRVMVYHYLGCGHCPQCYAGNLMWCPETKGYGSHCHGADADLLLTDERNCFVLPEELSFVDGAFMACIAGTGFSALKKINPTGADTLAVFGLGPVGLTGVMMGKAFGARVIAIGRRKVRLDMAREFGADEVVDIDSTDPLAAIREMTRSGVDMAYETSGSADAHKVMLQALKRGGRAVLVAGRGDNSINPSMIIGKQVTLMGSFVMPLPMVPELARFIIRHGLPFEKMITHRFRIDQAEEAFRLFESGECGKVIFEWN